MLSYIPRPVKDGLKAVLMSRPLRPLSNFYAGHLTCLMYHRILEKAPQLSGFEPHVVLGVSAANFEEQIEHLSRNFLCLDLLTAIELLEKGKLPKRSAIVTFDDGYRDNLTVALPILRRYGVPATVFICTGLVDRKANLWWSELEAIFRERNALHIKWSGGEFALDLSTTDKKINVHHQLMYFYQSLAISKQEELLQALRMAANLPYSYDSLILNWDEVRKLDRDPLITIGAHTISHVVLSRTTGTELRDEIFESKQILERQLGHSVQFFAYPYGSNDSAAEREFVVVEAAGFRAAFTTRAGHIHPVYRDYRFSLPRINIDFYDDMDAFKWKLSGFDSMLHQSGRRMTVN